ncbi:MAG: GNAT family N-acetyltransferase [Trueperaceae bacterium]
MIIRLLTPQDLVAFRALRLESLHQEPTAYMSSPEDFEQESLESIKARLEAKAVGNFVVGAFQGENLIGIAAFVPETRRKIAHKGFISSVYTTPSQRGKGVARAMMQALLERVKTYPHIKHVNLAVVMSQQAARQLYISLGFKPWGLERNATYVNETFYDEEWFVLEL